MVESLKQKVYEANKQLPQYGLVTITWGNVSQIDREKGVMVIKPSGVSYEELRPEDMVVVALDSGERVEGAYKPSSDTPTHLELYRRFPQIGGVVHTHSRWATVWAQAGRDIPAYGTTHADYFYGPIPCTRPLSREETAEGYERNTGLVIAEAFLNRDYQAIPGVLVKGHGPFCWGNDAFEAVHNAVVMEEIAMMSLHTEQLGKKTPVDSYLLDVHYFRKHGEHAYYGQR